MITSMHIENYKCFKDFDIELGPFTVLIGPNDSGKTAFLETLRILGTMKPRQNVLSDAYLRENGLPFGLPVAWQGNAQCEIIIEAQGQAKDSHCACVYSLTREQIEFGVQRTENQAVSFDWTDEQQGWHHETFSGVKYYRLNPTDLKSASPSGMQEMTLTGAGFATYLVSMLLQDRRAFFAMEQAFYEHFPQYNLVHLNDSGQHSFIEFKAKSGQLLNATAVSDGTILYLAFLALAHHPRRATMLLAEEPENGVHWASLEEIVRTLRQLAGEKGVQVILTTHSPYLLDLVEPDEVRVFSKDDEGAVHAKKMTDFPDMDRLKKHFMTGEIWTGLLEQEPSQTERVEP